MTFNLSVKLRERLFWVFDRIGGGGVKNALNGLYNCEKWAADSEQLRAYREENLQRLLKHAVDTTPFYREQVAESRLLENFPLTDKTMIRANQQYFMSGAYRREQLTTMTTSGSTGTPFTCYQNKDKKKRVRAEVIYYSEKAGYTVGKNLINLKAASDKSLKDKLQQWLQNSSVFDVGVVDDIKLKQLVSKMERVSKHGSVLLAYASTFDLLGAYFKRKGSANDCNLMGMISISELLHDSTRELVETAFGCRCYSRYSNQENGIIGQDDRENNVFILNEAHYLLEVFKIDRDEPAAEGETGRIVVTDLYNYAMPMIRYDTGDVGALCRVKYNGILRKAICNFSGRKIDLVCDAAGNFLSPHKISVAMRNYSALEQFQFVQESENDYLVRLVVSDAFRAENELKEQLLSLLGDQAMIRFEYVDQIPPLGSGKRNYIVNKLKKGRA